MILRARWGQDPLEFDGKFFPFLSEVESTRDLSRLRAMFDQIALLTRPDEGPWPAWPFDEVPEIKTTLPTVREARAAVVAAFWLLEFQTADPVARQHGVDPLEWLDQLRRLGEHYRLRTQAERSRWAEAAARSVAKTRGRKAEATTRKAAGGRNAMSRRWAGQRPRWAEWRQRAGKLWHEDSAQTLEDVARRCGQEFDANWRTVERRIADLNPRHAIR